jgi:malonyl-CoA decarboxylase
MRRDTLREIIASLSSAGTSVFRFGAGRRRLSLEALCRQLLDLRGEASVTVVADRLLAAYAELDDDGRARFFATLRDGFGPDLAAVDAAIARYRAAPSPESVQALQQAAESPRQEIFRLLNTAPGGTAALIAMRADLMRLGADAPALAPVERDLGHLLRSWFNRGFLTLERIDWQTPALILEKLIAYESVHEIQGWDDLRRRLADDRRCYAFFHPALPDEPLIFVEVALVQGLAASIQEVLDAPPPAPGAAVAADTAIFYPINTCQPGLHGITFGDFLIKQVADSLARDVPGLGRFSTLSPLPGFRRWLLAELSAPASEIALAPAERERLLREPDDWLPDAPDAQTYAALLLHLGAVYLLRAKRGSEPLDAVARFHLRNGARLERINWLGDRSARGLRESFGLLVNYVYDSRTVAHNHEAYVNAGHIACSAAVRGLLTKRPQRRAGARARPGAER